VSESPGVNVIGPTFAIDRSAPVVVTTPTLPVPVSGWPVSAPTPVATAVFATIVAAGVASSTFT
jgi:hypothetical protein